MSDRLGKYRVLCVYLILGSVTFIVYKPVLHQGFSCFDDSDYVTANRNVQGGLMRQSVLWAFGKPYAANWHPITWLSHILDCELFGLNPKGHHLVSLLLHIANTLLLLRVLQEMTGALWRSTFVAALFALHPLHVESVAWVAERKDVLSTLFWMLTMAGYVRYVRGGGAKWYVATLILFALGLMAKQMLVTLPFVLLLLDFWPFERLQSRKDIKELVLEKVPFFVLSAVFSVIVLRAQEGAFSPRIASPGIRTANAFVSYLAYIGKMLRPAGLAVFYPHPGDKLPMSEWVAAFVVLAIITILVFGVARGRKYLAVGWLWYVGTLIPVIGIVQVGSQSMADRYTYVPLTGLFIMIAWGVEDFLPKWRRRGTVLGVSGAAVLLALSICTHFQVRYWRDNLTLFQHALKVTKDNSTAFYGLGSAYSEMGQWEDAIEAYKQAIKIEPAYSKAYCNLGMAYSQLGQWREAVAAYNLAINISPDFAEAYYNLGLTWAVVGQNSKAIEAFTEAIKIRPDYAEAYNNLGVVYGKLGRYTEEIGAYKQAIKIRPDYGDAHLNLGLCYLIMGDKGSALGEYETLKKFDAERATRLFKGVSEPNQR